MLMYYSAKWVNANAIANYGRANYIMLIGSECYLYPG